MGQILHGAHDQAHHPSCETAIESSAQGTSCSVWTEPQGGCQVAGRHALGVVPALKAFVFYQ